MSLFEDSNSAFYLTVAISVLGAVVALIGHYYNNPFREADSDAAVARKKQGFVVSLVGWGLSICSVMASLNYNDARTRDAEAKAKAASEQVAKQTEEIETLRNGAAPREITAAQRVKILSVLGRAPKGKIALVIENADPETVRYAEQFRTLFGEAGFEVRGRAMSVAGIPTQGIVVMTGADEPSPIADIVAKSLNVAGLSARRSIVAGRITFPVAGQVEKVLVFVGPKPVSQ